MINFSDLLHLNVWASRYRIMYVPIFTKVIEIVCKKQTYFKNV